MSLLLFAGVQSFTTVTYGWSLGKIDIVEDIGVPCLMNSETAGCKDQCVIDLVATVQLNCETFAENQQQ